MNPQPVPATPPTRPKPSPNLRLLPGCLATVFAALTALPQGLHAQAAQATPTASQPDLKTCLTETEDRARLACYDSQAGHQASLRLPASPAAPSAASSQPGVPDAGGAALKPAATPVTQQGSDSRLSRYWELDQADKRGAFNYTGFHPNYFLPLRVMRTVNLQPHSPTRGTAATLPAYQHTETKLQLSMRSKVWENALLPGADLWVAYTQQSHWQLWNNAVSAPFRSTDFQPELIYVLPTPASLQAWPGGWQWRMTQLGVVHQSNGQSGALSRSWTRLQAAMGVERGDVSVALRLEQRLDRGHDLKDDNPDITRYLGRAQAQLSWSPGRSTAVLLWRPSSSGKGQVQLDWTYPVDSTHPDGLRWYAQAFHGFGETLLDYNVRQTSLGLGLTIFKF